MKPMTTKEENMDSGIIMPLLIVFLIGMAFGSSVCNKRNSDNPRELNGVDTMATEDSIYPIHFTIDTAIEIEKDYEPPEHP